MSALLDPGDRLVEFLLKASNGETFVGVGQIGPAPM